MAEAERPRKGRVGMNVLAVEEVKRGKGCGGGGPEQSYTYCSSTVVPEEEEEENVLQLYTVKLTEAASVLPPSSKHCRFDCGQ